MVGVRVLGCDEMLSWISHLDFNATIIINIKNIALPHDKSDYIFSMDIKHQGEVVLLYIKFLIWYWDAK